MKTAPRSLPRFILLALIAWACQASASSRWDVIQWCSQPERENQARCEGLIHAAVDLTTSSDFDNPRLCFPADTGLPQLRDTLVAWLKKNRIAPEQSGLGLAARAIRENYPCKP